jgi:hypothetical protein
MEHNHLVMQNASFFGKTCYFLGIAFAPEQETEMSISKASQQGTAAPALSVWGWLETGLLLPDELPLHVKLDSGALTSSLDARDLSLFQREQAEWVRFTVCTRSEHHPERQHTYERPVVRRTHIRGAGGDDHRPVVRMQLCLGDGVYEEEFTLRSRHNMNYPVLLGRRTIARLGLLDVTREFTIPPQSDPALRTIHNHSIHQGK